MKRSVIWLCLVLTTLFSISHNKGYAEGSSLQSYQNYNHGYCPDCDCAPCLGTCGSCEEVVCAPCEAVCDDEPCDPCDPCAPICGAECGISICAIGVAVAALVAAAAIILASGNGSSSHN